MRLSILAQMVILLVLCVPSFACLFFQARVYLKTSSS